MTPLKSIGVVAIGGVLTFVGITQAFESAGLVPDLHLVFSWSLMAVFGLYLIAWGLVKFTMSEPSSRERPTSSTSYSTALGTPSAHSHTKRRSRGRNSEEHDPYGHSRR